VFRGRYRDEFEEVGDRSRCVDLVVGLFAVVEEYQYLGVRVSDCA
jgi:hypothetical protein